ncbi:DUF3024 domain-containing protein [Sphingobacterium rhinopitheci]|uniref:DUF3024 domain-containing protein n=1 Tax=Sphingobacterium rhinopitheci TaxID=2781960 RepID=UPI001F525EF3|nr:DUF3024 domain-containing protein [Sphingobacterium rhinopitheci]
MMTNTIETISMVEIQLRSFVEARRPKEESVRAQLDFGYSWDGQTAIFFEIRPQWNDPSHLLELPFAKLRFVKSSKMWKLYWMRGSGKWQSYEPQSESAYLQSLINEIDYDVDGCFFG